MKILIAAAVIVLSISAPAAYADEASQRVIVEELLQTMKVDQMMKPLFGQMKSLMEQQFNQMGAPEDMKPILVKFTDRLVNVMEETLNWKSMKKDMIDIYMRVYTEDEVKGMLAFYKSPIGQSVLDKMPQAVQLSMAAMQKRMPELQEKVKHISEQLKEEIQTEMERKKQAEKPQPGA